MIWSPGEALQGPDRLRFPESDARMTGRHEYTIFAVTGGHVALAWNGSGISNLRLPDVSADAAERALLRRLPQAVRAAPTPEIAAIIADIISYFAGETVEFSGVSVDPGRQEPFFLRVYKHIRQLGRGETTTYGEVARALGEGPEMARDVGRAMTANPVPLIVPCHRVLAAGGRIGGFSAPGGRFSKLKMLEIEGVLLPENTLAPPPAQTAFDF